MGLEIKREVLVGEVASRRSAALPVAAALGGMLAPALLYTTVNAGGPGTGPKVGRRRTHGGALSHQAAPRQRCEVTHGA